MVNQRKDVPAGWTWRPKADGTGKPRWVPSPALRKEGWKGQDLKDAKGQWLDRGTSINRADAIAAAVKAWRAGELVPADMAVFAPPGAAETPRIAGAEIERRHSIGYLMDAFMGNPAEGIEASRVWRDLKPGTQTEYKSKLKRLVDTLAGFAELPPKADALAYGAYLAAVTEVRSDAIFTLLTPETEEEGEAALDLVYETLRDTVSLSVANGVMRTASLWLEWVRKKKRVIKTNPAKDVDKTQLEGRLKPRTWDEIKAMVEAAEALGYPSIADSIILGIDLSWSQADRLVLQWPQIGHNSSYVRTRRQKTNRPGETRLLAPLGVKRVPKILARQAELLGAPAAQYTHVLICEDTGRPWTANNYNKKFAKVRDLAIETVPSCRDFYDKDLRSTAVTVAYEAELNLQQIAGRTLHSLRQVQTILDNHYGVIRRDVADQGADLLETYLADKGIAL